MTKYLEYLTYGDAGWGDQLLAGLLVTVSLFLATLPFGLVLGFLIALAKRSKRPIVRFFATIFTTIFRGVPELLMLLIIFYGGQIALQSLVDLIADGIVVDVNAFVAGMIALGLVFSAFASETFVSALNAVPVGQAEAARALGLGKIRTMQKVVFPQVLRHALPGISNISLILQKETALVSVIALDEFLRQTQIAVGGTKEPLFFYGLACGVYVLLAFLTSIVIDRVDGWTRRGEQRV